MRIVVTGGSGFLGSRLMREFDSRGHETFNFDRSTHEGYELTMTGHLDEAIRSWKIDLVVHSAGAPGRLFCEEDKLKAWHDNVVATEETSQACARQETPLVFFSTSEVYGFSCDRGRVDEDSPLEPRNTYALTKVSAEQIVRHYLGDQVTIVRPTMPYGPGMPVGYGRAALPTFISNALSDQGSEAHRATERSWCYIDDEIRGLADVCELHDGGVYNVGRDDDLIDTYDLALSVYTMLHASVSLIACVAPDPTITHRKDISCARLRGLGWAPRVDLDEGIRRTADWLREQQRVAA